MWIPCLLCMDHQHSLAEIESVLEKIGLALDQPVTAYHIGGNAMCVHGLKDTTKDTDIVLLSEVEVTALKDALLDSGFEETEIAVTPEYSSMQAYGIFAQKSENIMAQDYTPGLIVELFLKSVCGKLTFSEEMSKRSTEHKTYGKLKNRICSKEDILLFKAMAGRDRDIEDMVILSEHGIDWDTVENESGRQLQKLSEGHKDIFYESFVKFSTSSGTELPASFIKNM